MKKWKREPGLYLHVLQGSVLGTFQKSKSRNTEKQNKKQSHYLCPCKATERTLFQLWLANGKFLNNLTSLGFTVPCCVLGWNAAIQPAISLGKHCLIEIAHWNRGVSFEQSPLRLGRWGWASCQCFETPRHSQRSRDFLEFIKPLEKTRAKWFTPKYQPVRPSIFWRGGLPLSRRWYLKSRRTRRSAESWEGSREACGYLSSGEREAAGVPAKPPPHRASHTSSSSSLQPPLASHWFTCACWLLVAW